MSKNSKVFNCKKCKEAGLKIVGGKFWQVDYLQRLFAKLAQG